MNADGASAGTEKPELPLRKFRFSRFVVPGRGGRRRLFGAGGRSDGGRSVEVAFGAFGSGGLVARFLCRCGSARRRGPFPVGERFVRGSVARFLCRCGSARRRGPFPVGERFERGSVVLEEVHLAGFDLAVHVGQLGDDGRDEFERVGDGRLAPLALDAVEHGSVEGAEAELRVAHAGVPYNLAQPRQFGFEPCEGGAVVGPHGELEQLEMEVVHVGDEVELFVNGVSQGRKPSGVQAGYRTLFETVYEPGNVTAVAYESGQEMGRMELQSADADAELWAQTEDTKGKELVYIDIALKDKEGRVLTDSDVKLTAEVTGDASAAGFGSGNPKPVYNFNEGVTETFHGRALFILRKTKEGGHGTVTVRAEDGRNATVNY